METGPYKTLNLMVYASARELKHWSKVSPHLHWAPCSAMEDLMGMTSRLAHCQGMLTAKGDFRAMVAAAKGYSDQTKTYHVFYLLGPTP